MPVTGSVKTFISTRETGAKTVVDSPKAAAASPEAAPRRVGIHFCTQLRQAE